MRDYAIVNKIKMNMLFTNTQWGLKLNCKERQTNLGKQVILKQYKLVYLCKSVTFFFHWVWKKYLGWNYMQHNMITMTKHTDTTVHITWKHWE